MLNWREVPFVRILVAFVAGVLAAFYFNSNHPFFMASGLVFLALIFLTKKWQRQFRFRWLYGFLFFGFMFLLGYQVAYFHDERNADNYFDKIDRHPSSFILGEIDDAPIKKGDWVRVVLNVTGIGSHADSMTVCSGRILAFIARDSAAENIAYGDFIIIAGKPEKIRPPENPHAFDYRRYLHFQNIHHQFFARSGDWEILENGHGNIFFSKALLMQQLFLKTLRKHLPTEKEFAVGSALILGYRSEIPEEIQTAYSQTGAMHVLAVSGLHVGIIFLIINFFLKKIKINALYWQVIKVLIGLGVIWSFALITGASPSVMRAAVMFSFLNVGLAMHRYSSIYNTLAASAFFILLYDPYLIASVGFQLSYLAVFGIVYFQPKIVGLWRVKNKFGNYLWQLTAVSLAAQIMTLPLTFYYFNQLPVYFWLTGLLLVPLAGLELGAGVALLLCEFISPPLAFWIGKILFGFLWVGNQFVFMVQQLPVAVVEGIWIGGVVVILLYFLISSIIAAISSKRFYWVVAGLGFLCLISFNYAFTRAQHIQARQMVVYKIYKHSGVDFFDGGNVYSITDLNMDEKAIGFASQGHRYAMGMRSLEHFYFEDTVSYYFDHLFYENGFIQFYDLKLMVIDEATNLPENKKVTIDYILIRNSPRVVMHEIAHIFNFKKIIFDNSNKKWQVEKWKQQCDSLGLVYHDMVSKGAFILDLNN